jgi:hypothetical protein
MNRTNFYNIIENQTVEEYDYLWNNISKFKMNYPVRYYRVEQRDVMRPDLISYKIYGTIGYWWLLMAVNGIQNPLKDIVVGTLLKIPSTLDIYAFQKQWSIR